MYMVGLISENDIFVGATIVFGFGGANLSRPCPCFPFYIRIINETILGKEDQKEAKNDEKD